MSGTLSEALTGNVLESMGPPPPAFFSLRFEETQFPPTMTPFFYFSRSVAGVPISALLPGPLPFQPIPPWCILANTP